MDLNEISEIVSTAKSYLQRLESLNNNIKKAEKQICSTYEETRKNINETFSNLKDTVLNILKTRENCLLKEAEKIKNDSIKPIEQCKVIIEDKVQNTRNLIKSADNLDLNNIGKFNNDASLLGSLPEVPKLKEVPYITFNFETNIENEVNDLLSDFGTVFRNAPVQILNIEEKPGGLLIEWNHFESDDDTEVQEYILQKAFGDISKSGNSSINFADCYKGVDTKYLVKDLTIGQPYSFRITCKLSSTSLCIPWSIPQVGKTNLKAFCWENNKIIILSNESKIASPVADGPVLLFSDGPQLLVGNSLEYTVLELDDNDCVIGLTLEKISSNDVRKTESPSFLLDKNGNIYIDGVVKNTKLPHFYKKLTISFTCEFVNHEKIRVSVDSNDKQVTYDWMINPIAKLYFVCQFYSSKWKVMVE